MSIIPRHFNAFLAKQTYFDGFCRYYAQRKPPLFCGKAAVGMYDIMRVIAAPWVGKERVKDAYRG